MLKKDYELRKVHCKQGSSSLLVNLPLEMAENKKIGQGDSVIITETEKGILIRKLELEAV